MKKLWFATTLTLACAAPVWAGGVAVFEGEGERITLEYDGSKIRLGGAPDMGANDYLLVDDTRIYVVSTESGQLRVMDVAAMGKMMGAMAGRPLTPLNGTLGEITDLRPLGSKESVAGIEGELHTLVYKDAKGRQSSDELVLSSDPRALEFTRALLQLERTMVSVLGQPAARQDDVERLLLAENRGLLRFGKDVRVLSLNSEAPAASRFALPASPEAIPDFGNLLQQMQQSPEVMEALGEALKSLQDIQKR